MMASSKLETVWGSSWDRSTEELRQAMIEFAERQNGVLKAEWIALLKKGFGEDYDREYPLQPLAEEHKKTQELQGTQESSVDDRLLRENSMLPLSNFVEHLVDNGSGESETSENQVLDIPLSKSVRQLVGSQSQEAQTLENFVEQDLDLASLGKSNEHVVCEPSQRVPCDSWVSKSGCTRQSQLLEVILGKRQFHKARWKRKMKSDYQSFVLPFRHFQPPGRRLKIRNGELNLVNQTHVQEYQHVKVQRSLVKRLYHRIRIRSSMKDPAIITSPHGPERSDVKLVGASKSYIWVKRGKRLQSLSSLLARRNQPKHLLHNFVESVNYLSVRVGIEEKRSCSLSRRGCVWDPGVTCYNKIMWLMLDENCSDDRALKLMQRNHKISFHGVSLELQSYLVVDHTYESHKLLIVCESIEMQVFSNLQMLGVGSRRDECAYAYLQRINKFVWCGSNISEGTFKINQFLKLMQGPCLQEYEVDKVLRFLACFGVQSRRLKKNLNTWSRLVSFDVDGRIRLEGLQSCLVRCPISDNHRLRFINEDTMSYVKKLCVRSKKNERVSRSQFYGIEEPKRKMQNLESECKWVVLEVLALLLQNKHWLTLHLEDKMSLSGASNSMWRVMVNGTRKVHVIADKSDQKWRLLWCFGTVLGMWKNKLEFASCGVQNKAGSEVQGKRLLGSNALSLLVVWRSLKQNTTQRERHADNLVVTQASLVSKWEQVAFVASEIQLTTPTLHVIYGDLGACEVVWFATFLVLGACALLGSFFHFLPP